MSYFRLYNDAEENKNETIQLLVQLNHNSEKNLLHISYPILLEGRHILPS